jgi:very-short-patch-repair endonuclease
MESLGLSETAVQQRVVSGGLHRVRYGAYAVGHPGLTRKGELMAAVLACGPDAVLSHRSAADLWGIREGRGREIDVTAPNRRGRSPSGIAAHRSGSLLPADRTALHRIPCTTVARTLLDLAGVVPPWELRYALAEAEVQRLLDRPSLRELLRRSDRRRGVARLRLILEELDPKTRWTRSEMERRFLRMCRRAHLPTPEVNVLVDVAGGRVRPDFLWRAARLIVEADSRRFHDTDSAFLKDRKQELRLQLAGWRVSRCTWAQIEHEPRHLSEAVSGLLALASTG